MTFFPKVNSLVVDADVYDSLTDEQRTILTEAATTTTSWAIDTLPTDADGAAAYCDGAHSIVEATDTDLQLLHDAAAPVVAELRQDPATAPADRRDRTACRADTGAPDRLGDV